MHCVRFFDFSLILVDKLVHFFPQYFVDYKMSVNYTGVETNYDTYFQASLTLAAQIPNVILNWANIFLNLG